MTSISPISLENFQSAKQRISQFVHETPLIEIPALSDDLGCELWLKCEQFHPIKAFKIRGATNFLAKYLEKVKSTGVITHSSGNHGQALAYAGKLLGVKVKIVVPEAAPKVKIEGMQKWAAEIVFCANSMEAREETCSNIQAKEGQTLVPPYDHLDIIEGQGTAALDMMKNSVFDSIICPVGGGGLLAGSALAAKACDKSVKVYAAEPLMANDAALGFRKNERVEKIVPNTIADGLRTTVGKTNFPIINSWVDDVFECSEKDIYSWGKTMLEQYNLLIEPSSAICLAAISNQKELFKGKKVGLIISGGNVATSFYANPSL